MENPGFMQHECRILRMCTPAHHGNMPATEEAQMKTSVRRLDRNQCLIWKSTSAG